eukprot:scaffold15819_cov15-Tisochrysis_lutea.AAC.1
MLPLGHSMHPWSISNSSAQPLLVDADVDAAAEEDGQNQHRRLHVLREASAALYLGETRGCLKPSLMLRTIQMRSPAPGWRGVLLKSLVVEAVKDTVKDKVLDYLPNEATLDDTMVSRRWFYAKIQQ